MIGDIISGAISAAGAWAGNLVAGPTGATIGSKLTKSLFERKVGDDSGFEPISTMIQPVSFGNRMGFSRPKMSKSNIGMAKTVNGETINAAWDARLLRYYSSAYKIKRTVTSLKA
tara:strand:- start:156 stop:500 length:345 start_codon:yes stop_codon:yes gene_type:complete